MELQLTFDGELVPVARHPDDQVLCSDNIYRAYRDAHPDCSGACHANAEDRFEADVQIVRELLERTEEWVTDYCTGNSDYPDGYAQCVDETSHDWPQYVKEWVENTYDDSVDDIVELMCDRLESWDCEAEYCGNEYAAYTGPGCCLWGFDIGEYEEQIDISNFPELMELHCRGELDDVLDQLDREFCINRSRRRVRDPETGKYTDVGRETYNHSEHPTFDVYFMPGGRWDFVVPAERMEELLCEAICEYCRKLDRRSK